MRDTVCAKCWVFQWKSANLPSGTAHAIACVRKHKGQYEMGQTRVSTTKITNRRIFGTILGLCVLSVIGRCVRADEAADSMAEMRRQMDEFNRQAQEER